MQYSLCKLRYKNVQNYDTGCEAVSKYCQHLLFTKENE
jgi:hypothetical protein